MRDGAWARQALRSHRLLLRTLPALRRSWTNDGPPCTIQTSSDPDGAAVAQHHSDLFEKVDGTTNHEVPIQIALGHRPRIAHRKGPFRHAATFFLRAYTGAVVAETPNADAIETIERQFPGTAVQPQVTPGTRLSDLHEQDSYSYILAIVYMGANSRRELLANWRECAESLDFRLVG